MDVSVAAESTAVRAILEAFQPGELGGEAIVNLLDGTALPSAKMPYTTYFENFTAHRDSREVDLRRGSGTTYMWMTDPVLFPFGSGLEFSRFEYTWSDAPRVVQLPSTPAAMAAWEVQHTVMVTNAGPRPSPVVVLAFVCATTTSPPNTPQRKLFGFERLPNINPGENTTVHFDLDAESLGVMNTQDGAKWLRAGRFRIEIGSVETPAVAELELQAPDGSGQQLMVESNAWVQQLLAQSTASKKP